MKYAGRKGGVPDHIRRGIRLSVAVLALSALGFSLVGIPGYGSLVMLLKWALLTCPVVTMPLLGKTSQVSFERALGTVIGGTLGFLATAFATHGWTLAPTETSDLFLACLAAAASFASVLAGQRFSLDLSAKLFVIAFILVCFSSQEGRDPLVIALTRVGGIVTGVVTMLLMSVLILPKSATVEALRTLRKSLGQLQEVNRIAWGSYLPAPKQAAQLVAASSAADVPSLASGRRTGGGDDSALSAPLLAPGGGPDAEAAAAGVDLGEGCGGGMLPEEAEERMLKSEKALVDLYSVLNKLAEQLELARTEVWVTTCAGRPFLLPGLPLWQRRARHLPWSELEQMATAIRRVARLLSMALFAFEDGFDQQLRDALGPRYPAALLPTLAAACGATIQELADAFPGQPRVEGTGLAAYSAAVQSLASMDERQRQQVEGVLKRHRSRASARGSWAVVIEAVLEEQRSQVLTRQRLEVHTEAAEVAGLALAAPRAGSGGQQAGGTGADGGSGAGSPGRGPAGDAAGSQLSTRIKPLGASAASMPSAATAVGGGSSVSATEGPPLQPQAGAGTDARGGMPLTIFPDTTQGRLAQVSFFSFVFLMEELGQQLEALHDAVDGVLRRLPG